jgi:hypothetical protein
MAFSPHGFKMKFSEEEKIKRYETLPSNLELENFKALFLTLKKLHEYKNNWKLHGIIFFCVGHFIVLMMRQKWM